MLSSDKTPAPLLSIIVIVYNMQREAPRTLYSLSEAYQVGLPPEGYEVIVVDNGSDVPLPETLFQDLKGKFRYYHLKDAHPSPASAINFGVRQARGQAIGIMIDGARIASPGVVGQTAAALSHFANPVICTIGFHLGPESQTRAVLNGYDQAAEDGLLESIGWQRHGYRLFEISVPAGSSKDAWFGTIAESNLITVRRPLFDGLGGFDERFDMPGGGIVNLDFYNRTCATPDVQVLVLFGEGTFHQVHGGIMTSRSHAEVPREFENYSRQYQEIRGHPFEACTRQPMLFAAPEGVFRPGLRQASKVMAAHVPTIKPRR